MFVKEGSQKRTEEWSRSVGDENMFGGKEAKRGKKENGGLQRVSIDT